MLDQKIIDLIIEAEKEKKRKDEQREGIPLTIYDDSYWVEPQDEDEIVEKPKRGVVVIDI